MFKFTIAKVSLKVSEAKGKMTSNSLNSLSVTIVNEKEITN